MGQMRWVGLGGSEQLKANMGLSGKKWSYWEPRYLFGASVLLQQNDALDQVMLVAVGRLLSKHLGQALLRTSTRPLVHATPPKPARVASPLRRALYRDG